MAQQFEKLNDWDTASYFHNRCLDVSVEFKYIEGEAQAFKGLGLCFQKVMNKEMAMGYLETALQKATEGSLDHITKQISRDLVKVYQKIAIEFQEQGDFESSLQFFEKCLDVSRRANV